MPELPDVESARQHIEANGLGRRIAVVDDGDAYVSRPHAPGQIADALLGPLGTEVPSVEVVSRASRRRVRNRAEEVPASAGPRRSPRR